MGKSKLLIVDDTDSNIDILIEILGDLYSISVATNGALALQIATQILPDLILLDIVMPEMDGYEVCRRLKNQQVTQDIPVIFVTIKATIQDEHKGLDLGAIDYIVKPFSPPIVLSRVKNHLMLKHQRDQLKESISLLQHEKELLQQKADLGILAGGFAHDLGNIFCSASLIKTIPETIPQDPLEWQQLRNTLDLVGENIDLGIEICHGFTNYLNNIHEELQDLSINELISVLGIYARKFKGQINTKIEEDAHIVHCKSYQIKRVLINLFTNAMQAVETTPTPQIWFKLWNTATEVNFSFKDNGTGIPQACIDHIFEEFFTTRQTGTGIGLFLVKKIIDAHHGTIQVFSAEKEGTEVVVSLPKPSSTSPPM